LIIRGEYLYRLPLILMGLVIIIIGELKRWDKSDPVGLSLRVGGLILVIIGFVIMPVGGGTIFILIGPVFIIMGYLKIKRPKKGKNIKRKKRKKIIIIKRKKKT